MIYYIYEKRFIFYKRCRKRNRQKLSYRKLLLANTLKDHAQKYLNNDRFIGGLKALELNTSIFWTRRNRYNQSIQTIYRSSFGRKICHFQKYSSKQIDLFKKFKKYTKKIKIWKYAFVIANLELSLLESLYSPDTLSKNYTQELIKNP